MDFAKLVTEYLNQRTEGDPSFIVSEESLAFVDLMRADDMDRRASSVESSTSSDARGEPSSEDVTSEVRSNAVSESHSDAEPESQGESPEVITTPASPYSDIALGLDQDAGVISNMPEQEANPSPATAFTEGSSDSEPAQILSEDHEQPEPTPTFIEDFVELLRNSEPSPVFAEDSRQSEPSQQLTEDHPPSEPSAIFTENGPAADSNKSLQDEGVTVSEYATSHSETTILEPPSIPDFQSLLQSFDRDYHPPDPPAGDLDLMPASEEIESSDPLQNTTEYCESMMSGILNTYLATDRRGA